MIGNDDGGARLARVETTLALAIVPLNTGDYRVDHVQGFELLLQRHTRSVVYDRQCHGLWITSVKSFSN